MAIRVLGFSRGGGGITKSEHVNNEKCAPKLIIFNEKKRLRKIRIIPLKRKLTLKDKFWHFLTPPHQPNSQNSTISCEYADSLAKIFLLLYPFLKNSTTRIAIIRMEHLHRFAKNEIS